MQPEMKGDIGLESLDCNRAETTEFAVVEYGTSMTITLSAFLRSQG